MSDKVWSRDYLEKAGAEVEWDHEKKEIIIDGKIRIPPDEISGGKSYVDKETLDAVLDYLGYDVPDTVPSTSEPTQEMKKRSEREKRYEQEVSRSIPGWREIRDYIYQKAIEPVKDWVIDTIWEPVKDWIQPYVHSLTGTFSKVYDVYSGTFEFLQKVKFSIFNAINNVRSEITERTQPYINFLEQNISRLTWVVRDKPLEIINYVEQQWDKITYIFTTAFDKLFNVLEAPVHFVSNGIIAGFELWSSMIFEKVEQYIIEHWEDTE